MSDESTAPPTPGPDDGNDPGNDAELVALPRASRPKSPIVALAVSALAAVIVWHLRFDLAYAFAGSTPTDLGDARALPTSGAGLEDNRFVIVSGQAERRYALFVEPRGERERQTIFRLLGAGTRLFVRATDTTGRTDSLAERWSGRLRRFDAVPWASSLRDYYGKRTEITRYLELGGLEAALRGSGGATLKDRMGVP